MSYSETTPILGLPQITETDVPSWLTDFNEGMSIIDESYGSSAQLAAKASDDVTGMQGTVFALKQTVDGYVTTLETVKTQTINNTTSLANLSDNLGDTQTNLNTLLTSNQTALTAYSGITITDGGLETLGFARHLWAFGHLPASVTMETYGPYTYIPLAALPGNPYDLDTRPPLCTDDYAPYHAHGSVLVNTAVGMQALAIYLWYDGSATHIAALFNGTGSELTNDDFSLDSLSFHTATVTVTQAAPECNCLTEV